MFALENEIIKIAIKHTIYDMCLKIFFDNVIKNFPKKGSRVPKIGEKFLTITDKVNGDVYNHCKILNPKYLDPDDHDLDEDDLKNVFLAWSYEYSEYEGEEVDRDSEQFISESEFDNLIFDI